MKSAISGREINMKRDNPALILSGDSHVFVKNIAEFSHYLAQTRAKTEKKEK